MKNHLKLCVTLILLLQGCDFGSDPGVFPATEILEIRIEPNPVVAGDSTRVTVFVKDSLLTDLRYTWSFDTTPPTPTEGTGNKNWIYLSAPPTPGEYRGGVSIQRPGYGGVSGRFTVTVRASDHSM